MCAWLKSVRHGTLLTVQVILKIPDLRSLLGQHIDQAVFFAVVTFVTGSAYVFQLEHVQAAQLTNWFLC